jgi:hypothetical protein
MYSEFSREIIISVDPQTIPRISLTPTPFLYETSLLYNHHLVLVGGCYRCPDVGGHVGVDEGGVE